MISCYICREKFKSNLGGQLTNHLATQHNISLADYIIISKFNGIEPKCLCGFCDERPTFNRGKFTSYAKGHEKYKYREEKYIENFGIPKCNSCENVVKFTRGIPNKYCSFKCIPNNWNQDKVRDTVKKKYGVGNPMDIKEFRDKISVASKKMWDDGKTQLNKINKTSLERYGVNFPFQNEVVKEKHKISMLKNHGVPHYSKTNKFREEASLRMINDNPMYNSETVQKSIETQAKNNKWNSICKKYKNSNLLYQSSYEYDFLEFCESNNILHLIQKSPSFKYLNKKSHHYPDYLYDNRVVIEIKSTWILNLQEKISNILEKKESVEIDGRYMYLLILDKDYLCFEELVNSDK